MDATISGEIKIVNRKKKEDMDKEQNELCLFQYNSVATWRDIYGPIIICASQVTGLYRYNLADARTDWMAH